MAAGLSTGEKAGMLRKLRPKISVELVAGDQVIVDETTGLLLLLIDQCG
jgi:hypothetical protein